ncbi:MAG: SulP family inorganic anion transporter [Pirellula sp.]
MPMERNNLFSTANLAKDLTSSLVVFLVALPLCLGIAFASNAPPFSGLLAGIVGGILVGMLSGSHTSVSGPAAGLTAIVAVQIALLESFPTFLLAVVVGGLIQIGLGIARAGSLSSFFPSSVIKGLLAAIGVILILKQLPHVLGHDKDPEGEMSFSQPDKHNTFSELWTLLEGDFHVGAIVIGAVSLVLLIAWDKIKLLKKSGIPAPLVVVVTGVLIGQALKRVGGNWVIEESHLVQVPVSDSVSSFFGFLQLPDFTQWNNSSVYTAAITIAIVASLETLLNLEAVDKLDVKQRNSPPSRELIAQGVGNVVSGMIGGIPITSVIVRSSVNINAGAQTKLSAILHGVLLLVCAMFLPTYLNMIPLSCLAAILLVTGIKLASPALIREMWSEGIYQFIPFIVTLVSIVFTDLLIGIGIGLAVSVAFILNSNLRRPIRRIVEKHLRGEVTHIELANQVSFLNRAALDKVLNEVTPGTQLLIDASNTDYIDPDILSLIRDFKTKTAPVRKIQVCLQGFKKKYRLQGDVQHVDFSTQELQGRESPAQVLETLTAGNDRFRTSHPLTHHVDRPRKTSEGDHRPLAVILSCIDLHIPTETIFDLDSRDIFNIRIAGNVSSPDVLGSLEYCCSVVGTKLIVVLGHTQCATVAAAADVSEFGSEPASKSERVPKMDFEHMQSIVAKIQYCCADYSANATDQTNENEDSQIVNTLALRNVLATVKNVVTNSRTIDHLTRDGHSVVIGAVYNHLTRQVDFLTDHAIGLQLQKELSR